MLWFAVTSYTNNGLTTSQDGILGMSSGTDSSHGLILIEYLYDAFFISEQVFSLGLRDSDGQSLIDIGYYDTIMMTSSADLVCYLFEIYSLLQIYNYK